MEQMQCWNVLREVPKLRRFWERWVQLLPLSSALSQSSPLPRSHWSKSLTSSSLSQAPEEAPSESFTSAPHPPAFPFQICSPQLLQEAQLPQLRRKHGQSILGTSLGTSQVLSPGKFCPLCISCCISGASPAQLPLDWGYICSAKGKERLRVVKTAPSLECPRAGLGATQGCGKRPCPWQGVALADLKGSFHPNYFMAQ